MEKRARWRIVASTLLVGLVVRCPLVSLSPLLPNLERELRIGGLQVGILSALPVLCMGIFAPIASRMWGVLGPRRMIAAALGLEALGVGFRGMDASVPGLYVWTFVAGAGAGALNAALPAVVGKWGTARREMSTGLYGASLNLGSAGISATSVPLVVFLGSWSAGLDIWAVPVCATLIVWLRWSRSAFLPESAIGARWRTTRPRGARVRLAILFACLQAIVFYGAISWMAPYYESRGMHPTTAGNVLAVFSAVEIIAMAIPAIGRSHGWRWPPLGVAVGACATGLVGLVVMPVSLSWMVAILLGLGVGAMFPLSLLLIADCSNSSRQTATLAGAAFFVAYVGAAGSPVVLGALRDSSGNYEAGWLLLLACTAGMAAVTLLWRNGEVRTQCCMRHT